MLLCPPLNYEISEREGPMGKGCQAAAGEQAPGDMIKFRLFAAPAYKFPEP